ncbi:MAG TPA: hypothetical protein VKV73_17530 [Chloroflexota bacterium]|nr:hypothetical protein [Chloroflexota bacterium]
MIFFYELVFVLVAVVAIFIGEAWSRLAAGVFLGGWFLFVLVGSASFDARLATTDGLSDDDRRFFTDARDGLRHLRLLFGLATLAALGWRLIAG